MVGARFLGLALLTSSLSSLLACADQPGQDDGPPIVTSGSYAAVVQHGWLFPSSSAEWRAIGFDLDHDTTIDNNAGSLIGALGSLGLPIADANTELLRSGGDIVAHVVRADAFDDDPSVAWQLWSASGAPPAFDGTDTVRRGAIDGELAGPIANGTLRAQWGDATIRVPLFPGQPPVAMPLTDARVELTMPATCHGMIGGLLDATAFTAVLDQVAAETLAHMAAHPDHEFTRLAKDVFDKNNDQQVTAAEVVAFARQLITPDVRTDPDRVPDAVSVGFAFDCAPANIGDAPTF